MIFNNRYPFMEGEPGEGGGGSEPPAPPSGEPPPTDTSTTDWRKALPEELQNSPSLKDVADVNSLAKQFVDQQKFLGNSIRVPSKEAPAEDWDKFYGKMMERAPDLIRKPDTTDDDAMASFYNQMGRPEAPDKYEMELPEGMTLPEERTASLKKIAHDNGLTSRQFKNMMKQVAEMDASVQSLQEEQVQTGLAQLADEWGLAYDRREKMVESLLDQSQAPEQFKQALREKQLDAPTLKWLYNMTTQTGQEALQMTRDGNVGDPNRLAPEEALERANELFRKLQDMSPSDPSYTNLVNKRFEYIKMANPNSETNIDNLRAG